MNPSISIQHLSHRYGKTPVFGPIDLELGRGETIGIFGHNGSGKTTLLRVLARLLRPQAGQGHILDQPLDEWPPRRGRIGLISHHPAIVGELTVEENLNHVCRLVGMPSTAVPKALKVVGLDQVGIRRGSDCSFGMQRRIEVARLLLTKPQLLLLDEAGSGLDESAIALIAALSQRTTDNAGSAVIVAHNRDWLSSLCTRIYSLDSGRLESAT